MKTQTPILIVDDDDDVREMMRGVLETSGYYRVLVARDGLEALQLLRDMLAPMVVLCDYQMPRQNGMQVIEALTSDPKGSPHHACIMVTANEGLLSNAQREQLRQQGIPIVRKPFDLDELMEVVDQAAERLGPGPAPYGVPAPPCAISGPLTP